MKKILATMLLVTMLMSIACTASATTSFWLPVTCTSTTNYARYTTQPEYKSSNIAAAIYVKHHDNVGTSEYTNHFRGQKRPVGSGSWTTCGSKWCTQGVNVPIQNNNIVSGADYTISARGNTNYYDYDGISEIQLSGSFDANSSVRP